MDRMLALRRQPTWQYPLEQLKENSPSHKEGISFREQLNHHSEGVKFIAAISSRLSLPLSTTLTAITYFHRYYLRTSFKIMHSYKTGAGSVFLACKVEESNRTLDKVAFACARECLRPSRSKEAAQPKKEEVEKWVSTIVNSEKRLLVALYFDLVVEKLDKVIKAQLAQINVTNDQEYMPQTIQQLKYACGTPIQNVYPSDILAAAIILWTSKTLDKEIPDIDGTPWWQVLGFEREKLVEIVNCIVSMLNTTRKQDEPVFAEIA